MFLRNKFSKAQKKLHFFAKCKSNQFRKKIFQKNVCKKKIQSRLVFGITIAE